MTSETHASAHVRKARDFLEGAEANLAAGRNNAVAELARAGREGARLAPTLARLLRVKSRSQYGAASVTNTQAVNAVSWARRLVEAASSGLSPTSD